MVILVDLALAVMVLAGALFLGATALALYKEASKPSGKTDDKE